MAGHGIAPQAALIVQGSKSSGDICGNTGADVLAFGPKKAAYIKAFRGRFWGGVYHFIPHPVFIKILLTFLILVKKKTAPFGAVNKHRSK